MNYLIPANSKKSALILGLFNPSDFWILGAGIALSLIFFVALKNDTVFAISLKLGPIALAVLLVMPVPYRHNVAKLLSIVFTYYFIDVQKEFKWRGWCANREFGEKQ